LRLALNRVPAAADAHSMVAFAVLVSLGLAYLVAVLVLGVMAVRIDDSHKFVKLIVETRRLRRQFDAPLEAAKRDRARRDKGADEIWPEPL
jgi:hypothetical protein